MVLCCLLPIIAIAALSFFKVSASWLYYAAILLCPISHLLMMGGHSHQGKSAGHPACHEAEGNASAGSVELKKVDRN